VTNQDTRAPAATLFTDGASKGNPGPAGAGFVLLSPQEVTLAEGCIPLGITTVGVAEYRALLCGLSKALELKVSRIRVISDSQFMVRQLQGIYRVRTPAIRPLYQEACRLVSQFEDFAIEHAEREHNERADALAKEASLRSAAGQR
jgi:ribonuclease HI